MVERLSLTGVPLLIYALIYSFTKAGQDCYTSVDQMGKRVGAGTTAVKNALKLLLERRLIIKLSDPRFRTKNYRADLSVISEMDDGAVRIRPSQNTLVSDKFVDVNRVKSDHNNKDIIKSTTTSYKHSGASLESEDEDLFFLHIGDERLVVMTLNQHIDLKNRLGLETLDYYITKLERTLLANPFMYFKNHYRTILNWAREDARVE